MRKLLAALLTLILATLPCLAQQSSPTQMIVPAGTTLSVVLTQQISSSATHVGDQFHAQLVAPFVSGSQVAIPAGTYVQGRVTNISQQDDRVSISFASASLAFPNGYVAPLPGIVTARSAEGWWRPAPNSHRGLAVLPFALAPIVGAGIGAAVAPHGPQQLTPGVMPQNVSTAARDVGIGAGIGVGVMAVGLIAYYSHRHSAAAAPDFFFEAGAPMDIALVVPVSLDAPQAAAEAAQPPVIQPLARRPVPLPSPAPDATGICRTPDIPGTPDIVIPGTPAIGDSPGTPDIVIPGTPSLPGSILPCS